MYHKDLYDIFGDAVPCFRPWDFLTPEEQASANRHLRSPWSAPFTDDSEWMHTKESGFAPTAHYLMTRLAKVAIAKPDHVDPRSPLTRSEAYCLRKVFEDNSGNRNFVCLLYTSDAADE